MARTTVMVVDDERNMLRTVGALLKSAGFDSILVDNGAEALEKLARKPAGLVVTDARMAPMTGFELLERVAQRHPQVPVIMMTAYATPKLAVEAIKAGAVDYIAKPFEPEEFLHVVRGAVQGDLLRQENRALKGVLGRYYRVEDLVGDSQVMQDVRELIHKAAPTDASILLLGESGTGKEMAASAVHALSERRDQAFIGINCAAIPENLLESELFGHERGAFTGAVRQRVGRFEEADRGTLFLDEIGDMGSHLQSKLLRVLEDGRFQRVGGNEDIAVDVRLVAATNQDIESALASGRMREDLYHRLNVVQINFPPLRERGNDLVQLAEHFLGTLNQKLRKSIEGFDEETLQRLQSYHWPGNVRELRNAIERAVIVETTDWIRPDSLPAAVDRPSVDAVRGAQALPTDLAEAVASFERDLIQRAIRQCHGRIKATAETLGISRHALRYRMQKLGMNLEELL